MGNTTLTVDRGANRIPLRIAAVLVVATIAQLWLAGINFTIPIGRQFLIHDVRPEVGAAYVGRLDEGRDAWAARDSTALLYAVTEAPISPPDIAFLKPLYIYGYLETLLRRHFAERTFSKWTRIGSGPCDIDEVRNVGGGCFGGENDRVYLSTAGNIPLQAHPAQYVLVVPYLRPKWLRNGIFLIELGLLLAMIRTLGAGRVVARSWRSFRENAVPGIIISIVVLIALGAVAETVMRLTFPFPKSAIKFPLRTDKVMGRIFKPNDVVRVTNGINFWVEERTNSLGFVDWEPKIPKPEGTFRILLVGDSFVEALQVAMKDKLQSQLAGMIAREYPNAKTDVVALGFGGTGQSNQLSFYEGVGKRLQADLVLLVFVANDFPNNSALLEGVRHNWSPEHPPRMFFEPIEGTQAFRRIEVDPDWEKHLPSGESSMHQRLTKQKHYADLLGDWNPNDVHMDRVIYQPDPLPPAFSNAIASTAHAIDEWHALAQRDGFEIAVVAVDTVSTATSPDSQDKGLAIERLASILSSRKIPLLDMRPGFLRRGSIESVHIPHDWHWNVTGHRWAAEEVFQFIDARYLRRHLHK